MYTRIDQPRVPDVDLMLSMMANTHPGNVHHTITANAARRVLQQFGVPTSLVGLGLVILNEPACRHLATQNPTQGAPFVATVGSGTDGPHAALRCDDWLFAPGLPGEAKPEHGIRPAPLLVKLNQQFWDRDAAVFLAGDDGSGLWVWATSQPLQPADDPNRDEDRIVSLWRATIESCGHPGWSAGPLAV